MSDLFLFLDEAGDFTFTPQASQWLVFTCLSTTQPAAIAREFAELRYDLFRQGSQLDRFHAAEDKQAVRDRVFNLLSANTEYQLDAEVVEKRKAIPYLQSYGLYSRIYRDLLRYVLRRQNWLELDSLQVICDTVPLKEKRKAIEGELKFKVKQLMSKRRKPYYVVFHSSAAHPFLQAADYCGWAIFRKWERDDLRSYNLIKSSMRSEWDVFRSGTTYYY